MKLDGGDCYQAAGSFFMDGRLFTNDLPSLTLVHGYPTLRRPPWKKFGHAWVEFQDSNGQWIVRDLANDRDLEMPRDAYYAIGNINPDECKRYSLADLRRWVTETGHWGPWEPEPEGAL